MDFLKRAWREVVLLVHMSYQIELFALFMGEVVSRKKFYNIVSVLCLALSLFFLLLSHSWPNAKFGFDPDLYKLL